MRCTHPRQRAAEAVWDAGAEAADGRRAHRLLLVLLVLLLKQLRPPARQVAVRATNVVG